MKNIYPLGLVVGKFYPFHKGHEYLVKQAAKQSKELIVMVIANRARDLILAETRAEWIAETFPDLDIRVVEDIGYDDDSKKWADYTVELLGKAPDVVFTSENYGKTWAKELGCAHVEVDKGRIKFPISGTLVREDPLAHWNMLPAATRRYFTFKVVLIGAESTGKSTLAARLAKSFNTNWVHEYGRFYTELRQFNSDAISSQENGIQLEWTEKDFINIARAQNMITEQLAETANKVLICDTDAFATHIWHFRYMDNWSQKVEELAEQIKPNLYLVTPPDIPFDQDGTRDGRYIRDSMHNWVITKLQDDNRPFHVVEGGTNIEDRIQDSANAINEAIEVWKKNKLWSNVVY